MILAIDLSLPLQILIIVLMIVFTIIGAIKMHGVLYLVSFFAIANTITTVYRIITDGESIIFIDYIRLVVCILIIITSITFMVIDVKRAEKNSINDRKDY